MASATIATPASGRAADGRSVSEVSESGARRGKALPLLITPRRQRELGIRAPISASGHPRHPASQGKIATIVFAQSGCPRRFCSPPSREASRTGRGRRIVRGVPGRLPRLAPSASGEGFALWRGAGRRGHERARCSASTSPPGRGVLAGYPAQSRPCGRGGPRGAEGAGRGHHGGELFTMDVPGTHPDYLFGAPPSTRGSTRETVHMVNHLKCAAFELPFGGRRPSGNVQAHLAPRGGGLLHRAGEQFTGPPRPIRPTTSRSARSRRDNFLVIDTTARDEKQVKRRQIIAEVDWKSAFSMIYSKASTWSKASRSRSRSSAIAKMKRSRLRQKGWGLLHDAIAPRGVDPPAFTKRRPGLVADREKCSCEKVVVQEDQLGTMENVGSGEVELRSRRSDDGRLADRRPGPARESRPTRRARGRAARADAPAPLTGAHFSPLDIRDIGACSRRHAIAEGRWHPRDHARQLVQGDEFTPTLLYDKQPAAWARRAHLRGPAELLARCLETLEAARVRRLPSCVVRERSRPPRQAGGAPPARAARRSPLTALPA